MRLPAGRAELGSLWNRLVEPPAIVDETEDQRPRLLAAMVVAVLPMIILVGMVLMPLVNQSGSLWQSSTFLPASIAAAGSIISYGLNRAGHFRSAVAVYVAALVAAPLIAVTLDNSPINVTIGTLSVAGVIVAGALSRDLTGPGLAAAGTVIGVLFIPLLTPSTTFPALASLVSVNLSLGLMILVFTHYRNQQEKQRQATLQNSIRQANVRLGELLETITALAALDFSAQAPVGETGDTFDALAAGLNALGQALEASTVSRDILNRIITSMADSLIVVDEGGLITIVNRATSVMLRCSESDLVGTPLSNVLGEQVTVNDLVGRAEERFYQASDDRPIPVFFSAAALPGYDGELGGLVCLARDISVQKQAEHLIRQNLRELALLNRTIAATAETLDIDVMLEAACRELMTAMGASRGIAVMVQQEERRIRLVTSLGQEEDSDDLELPLEVSFDVPLLQQLLTVKLPVVVENVADEPGLIPLHQHIPDQDVASLMLIPLLVRDQVSGIIGLMSPVPDVFKHRALELAGNVAVTIGQALHNARLYNELEEYNRTLEETVQARTAALQEANANLQTLSKAKDEFVSNVSHELRTPIASIKLYLGMLENAPERAERYLATLLREAGRLERTIEDLLSLSRIDQDQVVVDPEPVDLNALARQIVTDRELLAEDKGQSLILDHLVVQAGANGDPTLLGQVLSILLTNAIAYTPAGGEIRVATRAAEFEDQPWIGICVSDNGPGIGPDEQPHLFERFYRGQTGYGSGVHGTGLGLAIAAEIVRRHDGRLEVQSEGIPGLGTTFFVWLPAAGSLAN